MSSRARIVIGVVVALCLASVVASDAFAKPKSVLGGVLNAYKTNSRILEIKRMKDNTGYEILIVRKDKFYLFQLPDKGKAIRLSPVHTFDIEKVKKLILGAERANTAVINYDALKAVRPTLRAITLRENAKGELEFLVHNYHPINSDDYRKSYIVETTNWTVLPEAITLDSNPVNEPWSKEELGMPSDTFETEAPEPEPAVTEESADGESADAAAEKPAEGADDKPEAPAAEKSDKPETPAAE